MTTSLLPLLDHYHCVQFSAQPEHHSFIPATQLVGRAVQYIPSIQATTSYKASLLLDSGHAPHVVDQHVLLLIRSQTH
uniref:Uncharacterized protein n=1 Tax=Arundo donax TaxID=35708 RepID=A0A0A9BX36_ARUDO